MAGTCLRGHPARRLFRFAAGREPVDLCLRHAIAHPPLIRTSIVTALVVGTLLTAINQGNVIADGRFPAQLAWKIPLTYCVPFSVATFSALRISAVRGR